MWQEPSPPALSQGERAGGEGSSSQRTYSKTGRNRAKTLFLCIPSGTAAANLLRTPVFRRLREAPEVGRLVVVSPLVREARFREELAGDKVVFEALEPHEPGAVERRVIRVLQEKYVKPMPTTSMRIRVARERRLEAEAREVRYLDRGTLADPSTRARRGAMALLKRLPLSLPFLFWVSDHLTLGDRYRDLFRRERPDLVLTPTTGIYFGEGPLMARADRERVPILAIDLSWDHFTIKTAPLRRVVGLTVWNDTMRRQAVELHRYRPEQVCVTGAPQFDLYADRSIYLPRERFLHSIGADPTRKLIALTTTPPVLYRYYDLVIEHLLAAMRGGALGAPAQLLVRVHPRDDIGNYDRFKDEPDVIVEKPFRESIVAEGSNVDPSLADRVHLVNSLEHSDVVLNVHSTISIEAAIVDTPVINIAFDGPEPLDFLRSARRYYHYTHYKPLVDVGAIRVAQTPAEMVELVRDYLAHPEHDRDGRRRAVAEQCFRVDGRASERVAEFVLGRLARI